MSDPRAGYPELRLAVHEIGETWETVGPLLAEAVYYQAIGTMYDVPELRLALARLVRRYHSSREAIRCLPVLSPFAAHLGVSLDGAIDEMESRDRAETDEQEAARLATT